MARIPSGIVYQVRQHRKLLLERVIFCWRCSALACYDDSLMAFGRSGPGAAKFPYRGHLSERKRPLRRAGKVLLTIGKATSKLR
jgi:hypothetical protein